MVICSNICEAIISELLASQGFENIELVKAYENTIRPTPVEKPIVAFSVKKCELGDLLVEISDNGEETVSDKRLATITVSANIYAPYVSGSCLAPEIFEKILNCLLASHDSEIKGATCFETNHVREAQALVTKTEIKFNKYCKID